MCSSNGDEPRTVTGTVAGTVAGTVSGTIAGTVSGLLDTAASLRPTELAELLDGIVGHLLDSDLTGLSAQEHSTLVTRLVRVQHRQHAALTDAVAAFDTADVACLTPHRTTKRWLEHRTRVSPGAAAHLARTARTLRDHLPATRAELARGTVSPAHVSEIVTVVRKIGADNAAKAETVLLDLAREFEPSVLRRATAEIFALVDPDGAEKALHKAYEKRGVTLTVVGEHGFLDGVFDLESTELLKTALQPLMDPSDPSDTRDARQRRADALLDIMQNSVDNAEQPKLGGHRPHLSVVVDADTLDRGTGGVALPWTGRVVPLTVARRWACDAEISPILGRLLPPPRPTLPVRVSIGTAVAPNASSAGVTPQVGGGWLPLHVGRTSRTATPAQLKALRVRDGGCVHPGCSRTAAYCHAHHVQHWVDGGPTDLDNLVLLCRHHHRTLHAGTWSLAPNPGTPGRFWATTSDGGHPAQTAADRSPPMRPVTRLLLPSAP